MNDFTFMANTFLGYVGQLCFDLLPVRRIEVHAIVLQEVTAQGVILVQQNLLLVETGEGGLYLLHADAGLRGHAVLAGLEGVQEVLHAVVQRGAGDMDVLAELDTDGALLHHHGQVHPVQRFLAVHHLKQHGIGTADTVGHHKVEVPAVKGRTVHAVTVQVGQVDTVILRHRDVSRQGASPGGILRTAGYAQKRGQSSSPKH